MAQSAALDYCLDIPIDHRLRSRLRPDSPTPDPYAERGKHVDVLEGYGRQLRDAGEKISMSEIAFANTLAMPETKGGILVLLQQPPQNLQYDSRNFNKIVRGCETLRAVDNVLRTVIGTTLYDTSCFDAFPFQKVPILSRRNEAEYPEYEEAYNVCKEMIYKKQPDVVLCCYQSPDIKKFDLLYSLGVGKTRTYKVRLGDRRCTPVNAFHPSCAVNYNRGESCFRNLYMLETLQAFHVYNGTWTESKWMNELRSFCLNRARDLAKGKSVRSNINSSTYYLVEQKDAPQLQDFERWERSFRDGLKGLKKYLSFMCSEYAASLSDSELYSYVIGDNISRLACDCLLVMTFIVENREAVHRPIDARKARDIARSIEREKRIFEGFTNETLSQSLKLPRRKFGLQYNLRASLKTLVKDLNDSFIHRGKKTNSPNLQLVEKAFYSFATQLECALEQHLDTTTVPDAEDTSLIAGLSSLKIAITSDKVSVKTRSVSPFIDETKQLSPQKQPVVTIAASSSQGPVLRVCFQCKQPGHFKDKCPQTKCYRCVFCAILL